MEQVCIFFIYRIIPPKPTTRSNNKEKQQNHQSHALDALDLFGRQEFLFYCEHLECHSKLCFYCGKRHNNTGIRITCPKCKKWCYSVEKHNSEDELSEDSPCKFCKDKIEEEEMLKKNSYVKDRCHNQKIWNCDEVPLETINHIFTLPPELQKYLLQLATDMVNSYPALPDRINEIIPSNTVVDQSYLQTFDLPTINNMHASQNVFSNLNTNLKIPIESIERLRDNIELGFLDDQLVNFLQHLFNFYLIRNQELGKFGEPPKIVVGNSYDFVSLNPNNHESLKHAMCDKKIGEDVQKQSRFTECCKDWFSNHKMKFLTNIMDYYNTSSIKKYIVPIFIRASQHWFTLKVDVENEAVTSHDRFVTKDGTNSEMHKEARIWFSKFFGLYKLCNKKLPDSYIRDEYFSPSDIKYDDGGYTLGPSEEKLQSSLSHCHVVSDTEQTDGNNCALWVLCDIIGDISGETVIQHDSKFFLQLRILLLFTMEYIFSNYGAKSEQVDLTKERNKSDQHEKEENKKNGVNKVQSEPKETDQPDSNKAGVDRKRKQAEIHTTTTRKRSKTSKQQLNLSSTRCDRIVKLERFNQYLFGPLSLEKKDKFLKTDPSRHNKNTDEISIDMANAPHAIIEDCFEVLTGEDRIDYFNRRYFHRFTTYVLFLNTERKDYFISIHDVLLYGNYDGQGLFPVSVMVVEKQYLVARPAKQDLHLTIKYVDDGTEEQEKYLGIDNDEKHLEDACAIIHLIATRPKFRTKGCASKLIESVFAAENFRQIQRIYAVSELDTTVVRELAPTKKQQFDNTHLLWRFGFSNLKYCNEDSLVDELEDHEFVPNNVTIVWITRKALNKNFDELDHKSMWRIVQMENDSMLKLKYTKPVSENNDNPGTISKEEVGRWKGYNLIWQWSLLDYDDICAIPTHDRDLTMKMGVHACRSGGSREFQADNKLCCFYTDEEIPKMFQQRSYDSHNHDGLCTWLSMAMMVNSVNKQAANDMIEKISTSKKGTFSYLVYHKSEEKSAVHLWRNNFRSNKNIDFTIERMKGARNKNEYEQHMKSNETGLVVCFLRDNMNDVNHVICIDLSRNIIYDSAEEYAMYYCDDALHACVGEGRLFQDFHGVIVMRKKKKN